MTITPELIDELAEKAASMAINKFVQNDLGQCALCNDRPYWAKHEKHHEFIDEGIETLKRLQKIKWGSLNTLATILLVSFVGWVLLTAFGIKLP